MWVGGVCGDRCLGNICRNHQHHNVNCENNGGGGGGGSIYDFIHVEIKLMIATCGMFVSSEQICETKIYHSYVVIIRDCKLRIIRLSLIRRSCIFFFFQIPDCKRKDQVLICDRSSS